MSKRSTNNHHTKHITVAADDDNEEVSKRRKLTPNTNTFNILFNLPKDEFSHMITFLKIGEVIMLSLSCKLINNLLREHLQIVHPYVVNSTSAGKYSEWSIGRALKTHRKLVVNSKSIDEVNDIFDNLIERKEPFEKLFKVVDVISDDIFNIEKIVNLFSKPTGQSKQNVKYVTLSINEVEDKIDDDDDDGELPLNYEKYREESPISLRNLESIPIGFLVKELILEDFEIPLSSVYKVLSQFYSLEKLKISLTTFEVIELKEFSTQVPLMEKLKNLDIEIMYGFSYQEIKILYDLVKIAPNLEYLEVAFAYLALDDDFLSFLTQKCPNLKGISIENQEDPEELKFTDSGILKFLKGEPKLEYLGFHYYCCNVTGEIFTQIGQFSNLRSITINRGEASSDLVTQFHNLHFGGGMLNHLHSINIGDSFSFLESTQSEKTKFITSLIEMAPNIKDIGNLPNIEGICIFDYLDQLSPLLSVFSFPYLTGEKSEVSPKVEIWLKKSRNLEELELNFDIDLSNLEPVLTVKKLTTNNYSFSYKLQELNKVFPSLTELYHYSNDDDMEMIQLLKEGKWPDLKLYSGLSKKILDIRPNMYGWYDGDVFGFVENCKPQDKILQFEKEWLILDDVDIYQNASKIEIL